MWSVHGFSKGFRYSKSLYIAYKTRSLWCSDQATLVGDSL